MRPFPVGLDHRAPRHSPTANSVRQAASLSLLSMASVERCRSSLPTAVQHPPLRRHKRIGLAREYPAWQTGWMALAWKWFGTAHRFEPTFCVLACASEAASEVIIVP